ncbi:hypothetical protein HYW20_06580 [Candidatus Woesearchaeota archaeon]|nr:hypothetical protein [Candidatus Woesearchaeota archaeon]
MSKEDEVVGTIEEVVRDARLVDKGREQLNRRFYNNAPSFDPERRKFLKHAAVLAGLIASGKFLEACSTIEPVQFQGKSYGSWEAGLMSQDSIRGPEPLYRPTGNLPFDNHLNRTGGYAIDYDVPIGTPTVPTANAFRTRTEQTRTGGNVLRLSHYRGPGTVFLSSYAHLDKYADIIQKGKFIMYKGAMEIRDQSLNKSKIVAFSGNSGVGPGGGIQRGHLHFEIQIVEGITGTAGTGGFYYVVPGIDPFQAGIDAEKPVGQYGSRPVYWDGKTAIAMTAKNKKIELQKSLDTLEKRLRQSKLDQDTIKNILDRQNKPEELRDYLGLRVLQKKKDKDGKERYEFMPGSLMYGLMLEFYGRTSKEGFIAMLPFIFPPLKSVYQKTNPEIRL